MYNKFLVSLKRKNKKLSLRCNKTIERRKSFWHNLLKELFQLILRLEYFS